MKIRVRIQLALCVIVLFIVGTGFAASVTCSSPAATANASFEYFVSVADHDRHLLHVAIRYHASGATTFEMPVWNALYQVRDFSQYVTDLHSENSHGKPVSVSALDKTSWQVAASDGCAVLEYNLFANSPGPFSAEASSDHVFVNWAQVLVYAQRAAPLMLTVTDVPAEWRLHDLGLFNENAQNGSYGLKRPVTYDALVDSPADIAHSELTTFDEDGARYRIAVDADPADYNLAPIEDAIKKVVHAEVEWMNDRPFDEYTMLYHFPHGPIGGGMEHSYGTAVTTPAERLRDNALAPISTTAHEFFHLWNVKRIRPQSMEPVDYEHEQYTRSLWFCEGVTSTVAELMLVRSGLEGEREYLAHLSGVITDFEARPAHRTQSPEASSLEAWLEGRAYYRRPERSVSYYTSGELIGVLLDLRIRELTHGRKSLRDLFQLMNAQYAKEGRFYNDSAAIQQAAETVTGAKFGDFFSRYVSGTEEIPYDEFLRVVGLKRETFTIVGASAGFDASVNFSGFPEVMSVTPGSAVDDAGVRPGDALIAIDGHEYLGDVGTYLADHKPGEKLVVRFRARSGRITEVNVTLTPAQQVGSTVVDLPMVTPDQRAQRAAWIRGDDMGAGAQR